MQASSYSPKRGLTINQSQHHTTSSALTMTSSESERPTSLARDTIARSMSRYKGKRQVKPSSIPAMPEVDSLPDAPHTPTPLLPLVSPQGQSSRRHIPAIIRDADANDISPNSEANRSRKQGAAKASNERVEGPVRAAETHQDDAQGECQEWHVQGARNKPTISKSHVQTEAHLVLGAAVRPKMQQGQVPPRSKDEGDTSDPDGPRNRGTEKLDRPTPPRDAGRPSDSHRPFWRSGVKSDHKVSNPDKYGGREGMHMPLPKKSFGERMADHINKYQPSGRLDSKSDLKRLISTPIGMPMGGEMTSPSFDAPISAVNAGERQVIVQFEDRLVYLPVTPSTTPSDIISSPAIQKLRSININTSILLECFKKAGVERPLRKYEHIRDVLNSWDNDTQNTLTIVPSPTGGNDDDLEARNVSKEQPGETSVYLYHSQKPGSWDKRWVTLRSDGQVLVKKTGKDPVNICHLSDFDIYVPIPRQMSKRIKPPKKLCFAVKSQQKSSMFLSTANFIHFFSTSDKATATTWYKAVQQWRSWYLVNMLGEGQSNAKAIPIDKLTNSKDLTKPHDVRNEPYNQSRGVHNSTRNGKNTIQREMLQPDGRLRGVSTSQENGHPAIMSARKNKSAPPISFPKTLIQDLALEVPTNRGQGPFSKTIEQEPFSSTGLLGRSYSQRQKVQRDGSVDSDSHPGLNDTSISSPGYEENGGLKRVSSQRQKPKPLIDLTPQYQEPPQHLKKGRGVIPQQIPAGGLVDIATSPEIAIPIPPNRAWRRPGTSSGEPCPSSRTNTMRSPTHPDFK